jgi:hypothetical protein
MNEAILMRVMVSLNLADIMTATRPATPPEMHEAPNDEVEQTDPSQEPHAEHPDFCSRDRDVLLFKSG